MGPEIMWALMISWSVPQQPSNKPKKISEQEAQAKRLLKNFPLVEGKLVATKAKMPVQRPKVLSQQFVSDSDEENDNCTVGNGGFQQMNANSQREGYHLQGNPYQQNSSDDGPAYDLAASTLPDLDMI